MRTVHILRFQHSITTLCRVLRVNRSTYYKHFYSSPAPRTLLNQEISSKILLIYSASKKRLGAVKIKVLLASIYSIEVSVGRVYRLMKNLNLPKMSTVKPKFKKSTPSLSSHFVNRLEQNFSQSAPNQVWCSDITYIKVGSSFAYLCVIIDLFSRKVITWNLHTKMDSAFIIQTVSSAIRKRMPKNPIIFHSDQGSQYTSKQFRDFLDQNHFIQSLSNKSNPWDNAVVEAFFKFLKHEETNRRSYRSLSELRLSLVEYIDSFYNRLRPHSANGFLSPNQKERSFFHSAT